MLSYIVLIYIIGLIISCLIVSIENVSNIIHGVKIYHKDLIPSRVIIFSIIFWPVVLGDVLFLLLCHCMIELLFFMQEKKEKNVKTESSGAQ